MTLPGHENVQDKILEVLQARNKVEQLETDLRRAKRELQYLSDCLNYAEAQEYFRLYRDSQK